MIKAGLINGRHNLPVDRYIFNSEIKDVHDYTGIREEINRFLLNEVGIETRWGTGINQSDYTEVESFVGKEDLLVYVTGLSCVTAELVACCMRNGVKLTLMHYDKAVDEYRPQPIL